MWNAFWLLKHCYSGPIIASLQSIVGTRWMESHLNNSIRITGLTCKAFICNSEPVSSTLLGALFVPGYGIQFYYLLLYHTIS